MGGYAQVTGASLYGPGGGGQPAAYGIAVPSNVVAFPGGGQVTDPQGPGTPGDGALVAIPSAFWRSSGFGLILLVLLVLYFDVRLLNRGR